ncbi:Phage_integrase domain-containing protein [Nitrospira defluvii]|uniref:Phage_integrase domain-containing protein n=2 Tax=Nitrospira TaxID=1234 RepID=A0ABN7LAH6_9BACT|nr:hypothetical protein [Nitrospira tepida]CAE6733159.1 Phage_integrase domain-containing protein [Nitrospira defluvii]
MVVEGIIIRTYRLFSRPGSSHGGRRVLVFDGSNRLHLPLTHYCEEASSRLSRGTCRAYIYALMPFFSWLDTHQFSWTSEPMIIRDYVREYLTQRLAAQARPHHLGFELVYLTKETRTTLRVFLASLKTFYSIMRRTKRYAFDNPLEHRAVRTVNQIEGLKKEPPYPTMPEISGVSHPMPKTRLSENYFRLEGTEWRPQPIDDPAFPAMVLAGGRRLPRWRIREECIAQILFSSGARVSEVLGLTFGDWGARGFLQEATAFNKGSHEVRTKFIRFSREAANLLRRYVNTERRDIDSRHASLADYQKLARSGIVDLHTIPLFMTEHGTVLSADHYRRYYWNPACEVAGLRANMHQARHWYVTLAIRQIYETSQSEADLNRKLRELIEYMSWKSGWVTLQSYEHYFNASRHAEIQNQLHQHLDNVLREAIVDQGSRLPTRAITHRPGTEDADWTFLQELGGNLAGERDPAMESVQGPY